MSAENKKQPQKEFCVLCGQPTEYNVDTPIQQREHFIEGSGQLCLKCFMKVYGSQTSLVDIDHP